MSDGVDANIAHHRQENTRIRRLRPDANIGRPYTLVSVAELRSLEKSRIRQDGRQRATGSRLWATRQGWLRFATLSCELIRAGR